LIYNEPLLNSSSSSSTTITFRITKKYDDYLSKKAEQERDAERCAIEYYNNMIEKYKNKDVVIYELFRSILIDEVSDEDE
jgi:ferritin-like protein